MSWWKRVQEIEDFAAEEGITLPMPAEQIVAIEEQGSIVDLVTGQIFDEPDEVAPEPESKWWWQS